MIGHPGRFEVESYDLNSDTNERCKLFDLLTICRDSVVLACRNTWRYVPRDIVTCRDTCHDMSRHDCRGKAHGKNHDKPRGKFRRNSKSRGQKPQEVSVATKTTPIVANNITAHTAMPCGTRPASEQCRDTCRGALPQVHAAAPGAAPSVGVAAVCVATTVTLSAAAYVEVPLRLRGPLKSTIMAWVRTECLQANDFPSAVLVTNQ